MKKMVFMLMCVCLFALAVNVFAGTTYEDYNTTVGKFNGNGYTGFQTKTTGGATADLESESVGDDYVVDVRMIDDDWNAGDWTRNVDDNESRYVDGDSEHTANDDVRLQFSNDLFTPVDVQVTGEWRSN